mmetsp:Transcript_27623/g.43129  ORF Transcript_27623/g.43129 Transcript_27623/m.43129 type:complete len:171 (-) Transcript_27623:186-698(-)
MEAGEDHAWLDDELEPYYHAYYEAILSNLQRISKLQRRPSLVLTIRAHVDEGQMLYVSTLNGHTLDQLSLRNGGDVRFCETGFIGKMKASRWLLIPYFEGQLDDSKHRCGNVVRTFGLEHKWRTDSMDLICPTELCQGFGLRPFCKDMAESIAFMYTSYIHGDYLHHLPD